MIGFSFSTDLKFNWTLVLFLALQVEGFGFAVKYLLFESHFKKSKQFYLKYQFVFGLRPSSIEKSIKRLKVRKTNGLKALNLRENMEINSFLK